MLTAVTAVCRHGVCPLEFLPMTAIDYLLIGHITRDLTPHGDEPGGTVTYSGRAAAALGSHTAVLTSYAPDFTSSQVLADLHVHNVPSAATTTFENVYTPHGRAQTVHATATTLTPDHLPEPWGEPAIVHLAPVVHEVDARFIHHFPNSLLCLTPQGWLREWGGDGRVHPREWPEVQAILSRADVVVLSQEDLPDIATLWQYWEWSKLLVLTGGPKGCLVLQGATAVRIPTIAVPQVDPTGAGDIFATAYFIRYHQTGDAIEAAHFANFIAAHSVTQSGIDAVTEAVKQAAKQYEIKR